MDTNDYVDEHASGTTSEDEAISDNTEGSESTAIPIHPSDIFVPPQDGIHPLVKSVLTVYYPAADQYHYDWAELEVEYSWNASGTSFTCNARRYRVKNIGRRSGNVIFGFSSATAWPERDISNDSAIQDGNWHSISGGSSVAGNANEARIYFKYIFDIKYGDDPWASVRRTLKFPPPPPPTIIGPAYTWTDKPTLYGEGVDGATVKLYESGVGTILFGTALVNSNNRWSTQLTASLWQADRFPMTASQTLGGKTSNWATPYNIAVLFKPIISTVTVSAAGKPTVSGTGGLKEATLEIWLQGGAGGAQLTTTVRSDGSWSVSASTAWPPATHTITARQIGKVSRHSSDWADHKTFTVKPLKPAIAQPPNPAAVRQVLTITGVYSGSVTLRMLTEAGANIAGTFSTSGTTRTFTPTANWSPGTSKVKVVQTVGGIASDPSDLATLRVKPPKPAIAYPPNPGTARQVLTITGVFSGTVTLTMLTEAGSEIAGTFSTSWEGRTFTPTEDWPLGTNRLKVVQTVGGVASDPSDQVTLRVKPPKARIDYPPNPAAVRQELTITGVYSGTVALRIITDEGYRVPGTFSPNGTTRTFTPTENWSPGATKINVVQTVSDVESDPSDPVFISIKPPKPTIAQPPNPAAAKQALIIYPNVSSGTVTLRVLTEGGSAVAGTFSTSGTTHTFTPTANWTVGTSKVKAVQTVDGVASDPSDLATLSVKPPKPTITSPPNPAAADQELTITDVYSGTVTLAMQTEGGSTVPGTFSTSGTTRTFTPTANWTPGTNTVKVVQTVDGVASDPSDPCTFTVEQGNKPEAPQFERPLAGSKTSTRPTIRVSGQSLALLTVRHESSEPLHSDTADAEGVLEFVVTTPLVPGANALEVKQKGDGPESDWSTPHRFTVKEPPRTPVIDAPTSGSRNPRKPTIRGRGETRGQILLRHEDDPENLIATVDGIASWRWTAQEPWDLGHYTIQVQQTDDGDSSSWSEPRTFEVVDARYGIGDAGPVFAQPVVSNHESVLLRVQVVSGVTGEPAEGVEVEWHVAGEQAVMAMSITGPDGWASYLYTPDTAGAHTVLADLTNQNQGVEITQQFEVIALPDDAWAQTFELYLEGEKVDLAKGGLELSGGKSYDLELRVKHADRLTDASVTLEDQADVEVLGLKFTPPLGTPQPLEEQQPVHWSITCDPEKSGYFGLKLTSSILPDWHLPGQLIALDLNEQVEVCFDTFAQVFGGSPAYPCLGAMHTVTVRPKADSLLLGKEVTLELTDEAVDLEITVSPAPDTPQPLGPDGASWSLDCVNSSKNGRFAVRLKVQGEVFRSGELPMLLGHNKVRITETFGPTHPRSPAFDWRYGIRAKSAFTGQAADGVPVTVDISGQLPEQRATDQTGWLYVDYFEGESVRLTIHNLYDGSQI